MRGFAGLYAALDASNKTSDKVAAMRAYFAAAPAEDAAWAVYFLIGRRPRQVVSTRNLRAWAMAAGEVPEWLFDECYEVVGDLAETVALLLPDAGNGSTASLRAWVERLLTLPEMEEAAQAEVMRAAWAELGVVERLVWNKLITGAFRVGVAQSLVVRALAEAGELPAAVVAHRLMGAWEPTAAWFRGVLTADAKEADSSRPYPFLLAHALTDGPEEALGGPELWQAEWKWDGIRAQVIRRAGQVYVWSRGEELITDRFPEVVEAAEQLAEGTVIDGEILPWKDEAVLPFAALQRRIGRKTLSKKILEEVPAVLMAFDLLEWGGEDVRERPLHERRRLLERAITGAGPAMMPSKVVTARSWEELGRLREHSRAHQVEGLMLKRLASPYGVGRPRGDWWKWKVQPHTIDAVLIYAQRGQGRRASLYTDYTFGVWQGEALVPFCKAYSGLTDAEIVAVDKFVRGHTLEKFGPVRVVEPGLVFEIGFEGIARSPRHKSGVAVRFPRMLRWRTDKQPRDADGIEQLQALLGAE